MVDAAADDDDDDSMLKTIDGGPLQSWWQYYFLIKHTLRLNKIFLKWKCVCNSLAAENRSG
jgi:hypothetical protein